jgi:hypothetical protein
VAPLETAKLALFQTAINTLGGTQREVLGEEEDEE